MGRGAALRRAALSLALGTAVSLLSFGAADAGIGSEELARPNVIVKDGRVWARFEDTPLADAVQAIGEQASIKIEFHDPITGAVISALLYDEPLDEALRRVLGDISWVGYFDAAGHITGLHVYGAPDALAPDDRPRAPAAAPRPEAPAALPTAGSRSARLEEVMKLGRERAEGAAEKLAIALERDADPAVRWNAAVALSEVPDPIALDALTDKLTDFSEDPAVRRLAAWALGRMGTGTWALRAGAHDPDVEVRRASQQALERIRNPAGDEIAPQPGGRTMP